MPRQPPSRYADVDWSLTDPQIAASFDVTKQAVWLVRRTLGKATVGGNGHGFTAAARAGLVDWSMSNAELSRRWHVHPFTPQKVRREMGAGPPGE